MARIVEHKRQDLHGDHAGRQALRRVFSLGLFCVLSAVSASSGALGIGAYRCVSFNAGGAGGRCLSAPPIEIRADGSYTESSTTGRYTVRDGQIVFSESTVRGPGQLIDDNTFRFQYTYKGLAHTSTYQCFGCSGAAASAPAQRTNGATPMRVGVTLHIEFSEAVSGATSFAIVPRALASQFRHHTALPAGAVTGLVVDVSQSQVRLATNRYNQLAADQPYVVFLVYPAETVAVAAFHLPAVKSDFEGRLQGGIYRNGLPLASHSAPPSLSAPAPPPVSVGMESGPGADYPPATESAMGSPYPQPGPQGPAAYPASPAYPTPPGAPPQESATPGTPADPVQALEGLARALKHIGDLFNALGPQGQTAPVGTSSPSGYPAPAPGGYPAPVPGSYPTPSAYPAPPSDAPSAYPPPSAYPAPASEAPSAYPPPATALGSYPSAPSAVSAPKCNPNIPKYSQPGCAE